MGDGKNGPNGKTCQNLSAVEPTYRSKADKIHFENNVEQLMQNTVIYLIMNAKK